MYRCELHPTYISQLEREVKSPALRVFVAPCLPLAAADRARYAGVYALALPGGPRDFTVAEQGDGLTGQLAGQNPVPLLHYGNHTFGAGFDPSLRVVFTIEGGRATRMTLVQGGQQIEGPRK